MYKFNLSEWEKDWEVDCVNDAFVFGEGQIMSQWSTGFVEITLEKSGGRTE